MGQQQQPGRQYKSHNQIYLQNEVHKELKKRWKDMALESEDSLLEEENPFQKETNLHISKLNAFE